MKFIPLLLLFLFNAPLSSEEIDPFGDDLDREYTASEPDVMAISKAEREFNAGIEQLKISYRAKFSDAIKHADGAEIHLLSFTMVAKVPDEKLNDYMHIEPYDTYSKIIRRKNLKGKSLAELRSATIDLLKEKSNHGGAFCHFPVHGIRLLRGKRVIFQTSICWVCGNYFMRYPFENEASWVGLNGSSLRTLLDREMAIPQSEKDRFNAKHGKKKEDKKPSGKE